MSQFQVYDLFENIGLGSAEQEQSFLIIWLKKKTIQIETSQSELSTPDFVPSGKMRHARGARSKPTPESKALLSLFPLIWRRAGKKLPT